MSLKKISIFLSIFLVGLAGFGAVVWANANSAQTFDQETVLGEAESFFGAGAEGLADVIEKIFEDQGQPVGYIAGREAAGAAIVGLRYGDGDLLLKNGYSRKVHWQGPSVGIDWGGNASKVFVLVYELPSVESLFQRFPGVDGSLYFVGGVGMNYVQRDEIVLAPIRLGVGLRAGANIGYMKVTPEKTWNPF